MKRKESESCQKSPDKIRGNGNSLENMKFNLWNTIVKVVKHWNRLPSEVLEPPFVEMFKI